MHSPDSRGVSEILGYSLVFTLVVFSIAVVSVGGLSSYQSAEEFERQNNAQKAFDVLHNNLEDIYYQGGPSRGTEIDLGETSLTLADPITVNVTVNGTTRNEFEFETRPLVQDLGDGSTLVYEAGAVFQTTRDGGVVREQPPFTLRDETAHFLVPVLSQRSDRSIGSGTVLVRAQRDTQRLRYSNSTQDPVNVTLTITSPRGDLWYEYLTARGPLNDGNCSLNGNEVTCGPVEIETVYVVESNIKIFFDR